MPSITLGSNAKSKIFDDSQTYASVATSRCDSIAGREGVAHT
jgi:hypothetical protein